MEILTAFGALVVVILGIVAVVFLLTLLRAFVLINLWGWFIVPLFQLPALNYPYAIGLSLVIGLFFVNKVQSEGKEYWIGVILSPLLALFIGWIVQMFL